MEALYVFDVPVADWPSDTDVPNCTVGANALLLVTLPCMSSVMAGAVNPTT